MSDHLESKFAKKASFNRKQQTKQLKQNNNMSKYKW